jgi:uncharacterized protein YbjT (DUF2867 family)
MVRNKDRASAIALPHVEVVEGDFDRPATLHTALAGVERAFLLTSSSERTQAQQIVFIFEEFARDYATMFSWRLSLNSASNA